ncbi:unnamed protein product [Urochloa decumbens]|uniref:Alliinase C-terminal domain-containing protein n=1 Tax=Urochloa decumbens TaxID=240449 RepID=A0ABC8YPS9_9POAL
MDPAASRVEQQARRRPAVIGLLAVLSSSLLLNALLLAHHFVLSPPRLLRDDGGSSCGLSWSLPAAREAEAVAAVDFSGHGQAFLDGVAGEDGRPACECNACFAGPDCSLRTPNCTADADRTWRARWLAQQLTHLTPRTPWLRLTERSAQRSPWLRPGVEHLAGGVCRSSLVVVGLSVVVSMEVGTADIGADDVVEDADELREAEDAGEGAADATDVMAYSSSTCWRLRSISRRILASSKAVTMLLTVVVAPVFIMVGSEGGGPRPGHDRDPFFLEPYWRRHAAAGAVVISGWHRMSYVFPPDGAFQSAELERHIRRLHRAVGNAVVDDKHLVFGASSTHLINALVHALSPDAGAAAASPPARVVATAPYYPKYRIQTVMLDGREYEWSGTTARWANVSRNYSTGGGGFIEFVTSPNNPDGLLTKPVLAGSAAAIFDHAYYWPHFTHIPAPADEDVMMFTMSKPSGHAGSRLGWALIRDENVAKKASEYVHDSVLGMSRDTQLRMLGIVKAMLANLHGKEDIFAFGHDVMRTRWRRLSAVVSRSRRISLQTRTRWRRVKCEREDEDKDCYEALLKANIITRSGVKNEAGKRYTRISLLKSDDDFDVLMERLTDLVNADKYDNDAPWSSSM